MHKTISLGKIQHGTRNYVEIENVRAVESAQGTNPTDGMPRGFLVTTGYCTEKLSMLEDGRVELVQNVADPAVNPADGSALEWTYQLGGQDGETADRHEYDGLTFVHQRLDENGAARAQAQQPDYQHVAVRATTSQPSLYIRSNSKEENVNIVQFVHEPPGEDPKYFAVSGDGETQISNLVVGPAPLELLSDQMEVRATLEDTALKFYAADPNQAADNFNMKVSGAGLDGWFNIIMDKATASQSNYITIRKGSGANAQIVNEMRSDGTWRVPPQAPAVGQPSRTDAAQSGSTVLDPNSLYIGNSRYSYDMSNRTVQLHKLKDDHIPVYMQAHMSANDLPSGHGLEHMTINKWVDFARTHLSDDDLDVHDVFPYANADWDVADAPVPTLTAAYNAMSTDLTAAENDIDATEASIVRTSCVAHVHVDASRTETYTETGTKHAPYKSLSDAMVAKLTDGATQTIIFKVKPGTYNVGSGINIQQTALKVSQWKVPGHGRM